MVRQAEIDKPPYAVPSVAEILASPRTGLVAASLFAGCGGSCLGLEWAGIDVRYANEFLPNAAECHRLNFSSCDVDGRDVRKVCGHEIVERCGGRIDILNGSPPCQSFSMACKRESGWGKSAAHADGTTQRSDDLFLEFARILREVRPAAFVAENVKGLVTGVAKGYFKLILRALRAADYRVAARVLDAQWLGVPQSRRRVIFVGIRADLGIEPEHPRPLPWRYSVADACPWIVGHQMAVGNDAFEPKFGTTARPSPTLMAGGARTSGLIRDGYHSPQGRTDLPSPTIRAGRAFSIEPEAWLSGNALKRWGGLREGRSLEVTMFNLVRSRADAPMPELLPSIAEIDGAGSVAHPSEARKFSIGELRRLCGFPDDFRLAGKFSEQWARLGNSVPPPMMRAVAGVVAGLLRGSA